MRVQQVDGEFRVVLSAEAMAALQLREGAAVEVQPVEPANDAPPHRYISLEEGLASFERTEPLHRNTYMELAK